MRRGQTDLHTLAGAYALDAVPDTDRAHFERHLARCEACVQEIRGLREATARLGASAAVRPRAELKEQALRAIARTRQLPPLTRDGHRARPGWRARPARSRAVSRFRQRPWLPRLATALAAGFLAVAVAMGVLAMGARHQVAQDQDRGHAIAAVLNASDVIMLTARVTTGGNATVLESRHEHSLVFTASGLPALPPARSYELWLMGPGGTRPAGMLPHPRAGMIGPMVVSGLAAGDRMGLTVEPAGGSARPTSAAILVLRLGS
jgi:anti-sigma-K factor RskA